MKILKIILAGIALIFVIVFLGSLFLPKSYNLERSIVINAPAKNIFPLIGELRNWAQWSPWHERDSEMVMTFGASTTGVGGTYSWVSEKAGSGTMKIIEFVPSTKVALLLSFKGWEDSPSTATFIISPTENGHTVAWGFAGEFQGNPIKRYFGLMFDKLVGGDYEIGLANLKAMVEAE